MASIVQTVVSRDEYTDGRRIVVLDKPLPGGSSRFQMVGGPPVISFNAYELDLDAIDAISKVLEVGGGVVYLHNPGKGKELKELLQDDPDPAELQIYEGHVDLDRGELTMCPEIQKMCDSVLGVTALDGKTPFEEAFVATVSAFGHGKYSAARYKCTFGLYNLPDERRRKIKRQRRDVDPTATTLVHLFTHERSGWDRLPKGMRTCMMKDNVADTLEVLAATRGSWLTRTDADTYRADDMGKVVDMLDRVGCKREPVDWSKIGCRVKQVSLHVYE